MGVHGLWKLIEPSGQMVPLESLAGKILAVDVSIWLHQAVKGMHDAQGAPVAVAHLLILFHRLCKLLFYKIKPVFVFDGGVPALKRQTMAARRQQSSVAKSEAMKVREKLIKNLLKHEAVRQVLSSETASVALGLNSFALPGPSVEEELYKLPPIAADYDNSESSECVSSGEEEKEDYAEDIHSVDVTSKEFLSLPPEVRHDILTELIDTRKQSSWKFLDAMPKQSDNFSDFQMSRLLKRRAVQTSLESAGKEMGGKAMSLKELESLLGDQGVLDPSTNVPGRRIAKDSVTHYVLVQKSSTEKKEEKKFDIAEHLEDVGWSSESDTDVIAGKKLEKKRPDVVADGKKTIKEEGSGEIKEIPLLSKQPKVRMTEEIANILSVLEDENAEKEIKMKVEGLQNKIILTESVKIKKEKVDSSESENQKALTDLMNDLDDECVTDKVENNNTPASTPIVVKEEEMSEDEAAVKKEPLPVPHMALDENCQNFKTNDDLERSPEVENLSRNIDPESGVKSESSEEEAEKGEVDQEQGSSRSSDVEDDFVVVAEDERTQESLNGDPKLKDHLSVTIRESDTLAKDDIFADVFESGTDEMSKESTTEVNKNEEKEKEITENEYKAEFEKPKTKEDFSNLQKSLEEEQLDLMREQGKQERHALNPTDQMYSDAQELLRLFGIPYIVAPMEAEAQCATLNLIGLTEGTITDDSDIWLFGGRVVYKNFFNQNKHVLEYRSDDIHKYFKLSREDMIKLALLVGSDYTVGLNGIGPVTALEILANFRSQSQSLLDSLQKFKDWFNGNNKCGPPRTSLKKKIKNTIISPGFPSQAVAEAYLHPQVDDSKEPFSWAKPNLELIRKYAKSKMGWSPEKCNELLLPVFKKMEENANQFTMDKYFRIVQKTCLAEGSMSKRVENAIKRLGGDLTEETEEDEGLKPKRKRKAKESKSKETESSNSPGSSSEKANKSKTKPEKEVESQNSVNKESKTRLINQRLHQDVKVPQKEMSKKLQEERKKQAIEIFRTYKKGKKKRTKVYAKEEVKLSESSSGSERD